jgi:hypothetical protein
MGIYGKATETVGMDTSAIALEIRKEECIKNY